MAYKSKAETAIDKLNAKLYGENGFDGDIPQIKDHIKEYKEHFDDHSKRLTIVETLQKERNKPSKKSLAGYIAGGVAIIVALLKSFMGN